MAGAASKADPRKAFVWLLRGGLAGGCHTGPLGVLARELRRRDMPPWACIALLAYPSKMSETYLLRLACRLATAVGWLTGHGPTPVVSLESPSGPIQSEERSVVLAPRA